MNAIIKGLLRAGSRIFLGFVAIMWVLASCSDFTKTLAPSITSSPTPSASASPAVRLLPAVHAKRNRNYAFMTGINSAQWDPCLPIRYVVNPSHQPPGGLKAVKAAVASVSKVTGLQFVYVGRTSERYSANRADYQPARYPDQWAPVLISWETDKQFNRDLRGSGETGTLSRIVGWGGPQALTLAHAEFETPESYIITGTVTLRASYMGRLLRSGSGAAARAVIVHELGHVVGLDHVKSQRQIMNAEGTATRFGAGDRYGFALAGSGKCAAINRRPVPHAVQ